MNTSLFDCRFVLVRTSHPGNIGAVARAMKTMGFHRLLLVSPQCFPHEEAYARATHATDILDQAIICHRLEDALAGTVAQYGLSARHRDLSATPSALREAMENALELRQGQGEIAFVFGNETSGLTNDELALCSHFAVIPTPLEAYSSLNLGAAAQVVAYESYLASTKKPPQAKRSNEVAEPLADFNDYEGFYHHLEQALGETQFLESGNRQRIMRRLRRLFNRAALEQNEVMILRGILTAFERMMKKP